MHINLKNNLFVVPIIIYFLFYLFLNYFLKIDNLKDFFYVLTFIYALYFIISYLILKKQISKKILFLIIILSFLIRILFFGSNIFFNPDTSKYIFQGKLIINQINPYKYFPAADELNKFHNEEVYENINTVFKRTIYPPLAHVFFSFVVKWFNTNIIGFKLFYILAEILITFFLYKLLKNKSYILLYLLCPLLITETYINLHFEIIAVLFVIISFYLLNIKKYIFSFLFLAISFHINYITIIFLPCFFYLTVKESKDILLALSSSLLYFIIIIALFFPFLSAGYFLFEQGISFFKNIEFNSSIYKLLILAGKPLGIKLMIGLILIYLISILFLVKNKYEIIIFSVLGFLFLFNKVYPWYLIWLIPWLCFYQSRSAMLFIYMINFSYILLLGKYSGDILFVEYIIIYGYLIFDIINSKILAKKPKFNKIDTSENGGVAQG